MAITTLFLTGFEHGFVAAAATAGTGLFDNVTAGVTADTSSPRNGNYCCRIINPGDIGVHEVAKTIGSQSKMVMRVAVKVSVRPPSIGSSLMRLGLTTGVVVRIDISSAGVLSLFEGSTERTGPTIDTTSWHVIELQLDSAVASCDWKVDGVAQTQLTVTPQTAPTTAALGLRGDSSSYTADFDDWIVGTWTNAATDWYGDGKVLAQRAGVDGTHATITSLSPGDAGTAYSGTPTTVNTMVDDPPATLGWTATRSTTDNIALRTATVGAYASIGPAVTAETGQANGVRAIMSYSSSTATANLAACDVRNSANAITELWGLTGGVGKAYNIVANQFKGAMVTVPAAGWTAAEVNAVRFRFGGCTSADINPVPTVQAMMLEVDWPIGAPAAPTYPAQRLAVVSSPAVHRAASR